MGSPKPQPIRKIICPQQIVFALLREPRKRRRFDHVGEIPGLDSVPEADAARFAGELLEFGLIARDHGRYTIIDWPITRIVEHLTLALAVQTMAAGEAANRASQTDFSHLAQLNGALREYDAASAANLLGGAYLDYQFHLELVRLSGSQVASSTYSKVIPPAVWIAGANYYQLEEARSSLAEHDRLIQYMMSGDAVRAREAVAFHLEEAVAQIRRAGEARIESYPDATP